MCVTSLVVELTWRGATHSFLPKNSATPLFFCMAACQAPTREPRQRDVTHIWQKDTKLLSSTRRIGC